LLAWWLLWGVGALWKQTVWAASGEDVTATAQALGGRVRPLWTGWRVDSVHGRVDWCGGLSGLVTRIAPVGGRRVREERLLRVDEVLALFTVTDPR
jgi:hypothetical protein